MKTLDYIVKLTNTPSPTGFTTDIMNYIKAEVESFGYTASKTAKGGVLVTVPGENDQEHRMVTAHLDTLGPWCVQSSQMADSKWIWWEDLDTLLLREKTA